MGRALAVVGSASLVALAACGGGGATAVVSDGDMEAHPNSEATPDPTSAPTSNAVATATADAAHTGSERSPTEQLARDMMKTGRKIGWSPTKKSIAYGELWMEGAGRGLRVVFRGADDKSEVEEICKPSECEETLDEKLATEVPKVGAKLEADGYQALMGNGWAVDQPELEIHSADLKLTYVKGKLSMGEGKQVKSLGSGPTKGTPVAVFIAKDDKMIVVDFELEAPKSSGPFVTHELRMYKLP